MRYIRPEECKTDTERVAKYEEHLQIARIMAKNKNEPLSKYTLIIGDLLEIIRRREQRP